MNDLTIANRESQFLKGVYEGLPLDEAAKKAGFTHYARDAYPILERPEVRAAFKKKVRARAETEGISICYDYFISVIRNTKATTKERLDAAKFLYANNMAAPKALEVKDEKETKDLNSMTNEELKAFIDASESELAERATPIEDEQDIDRYM